MIVPVKLLKPTFTGTLVKGIVYRAMVFEQVGFLHGYGALAVAFAKLYWQHWETSASAKL